MLHVFDEEVGLGGGWKCDYEAIGVNLAGWLVGFNGPLRQYFSLYRNVSQREEDRGEKE